jgi:ABC-2 type transport system permease protein
LIANVWALARREVQASFASPVAYTILAVFVFLFGYFFSDYLYMFLERSMGRGGFGAPAEVLNVNQDLIRWLFHTTSVVLLFLIPSLTMRSFAEEIRSGTIELLLTSPLTDFQIVAGKFLGAVFLYASMLVLTFAHMGLLFYFGDPEWKPLVVGYLGMFLLGSSFIALGLVFSSVTSSQLVATALSFTTFLFLWLIEYAESWAGSASGVVVYLSVTKHIEEFAKGVVDSRDVVYYLSFIGFSLFLAKKSIESFRWRG